MDVNKYSIDVKQMVIHAYNNISNKLFTEVLLEREKFNYVFKLRKNTENTLRIAFLKLLFI